jgi:hypothetical protein
MSRLLWLAAGVLLMVVLLPLRAEAASCPSYFNKLDPNKCNADGFCGWFDLRATTSHDGVVEEEDPPPEVATLPGPWAASRDVTVGSGDFFAINDSDFDAGRSRVAARSDVHLEVPFDFPTFSTFGQGRALALTRVTDLVFSGPAADVETSLRLVFDATLSEVAENIVEESLHSGMTVQTTVYVGGGLCRGVDEYVDFIGYHLRSLIDDDEGEDLSITNDFFLLDQVPLEGQTELVVGPFTAPTGEPLTLEFWIETSVTASGNGGFVLAAADFALALGPIGGGPVFDLPPGYTANSPTAGIVANQVPEPGSGMAGALTLAALAWRERRNRRGFGPRVQANASSAAVARGTLAVASAVPSGRPPTAR